jgi:hypothetical protein
MLDNNSTRQLKDSAKTTAPKKKIYIEPEHIITCMILADKKNKLTMRRLLNFVSYLREQLGDIVIMPDNIDIRFNISYESVARSVRYHDDVFFSVGDVMGLIGYKNGDKYKKNILDRLKIPPLLQEVLSVLASEFAIRMPIE